MLLRCWKGSVHHGVSVWLVCAVTIVGLEALTLSQGLQDVVSLSIGRNCLRWLFNGRDLGPKVSISGQPQTKIQTFAGWV